MEKIASLVAEIGADTSKLKQGLDSSKAALQTSKGEIEKMGTATKSLETKADAAGKELNQLADAAKKTTSATSGASKANEKFAETGQISDRVANKLTGSMSNLAGEILEENAASVIAFGSLIAVSQAFEVARKAAEEFGNTQVTKQIKGMDDSLQGLKKTIAEIPIGPGVSLLDFLGRAADGLGNVAKLTGAAVVMYELYSGAISVAEYNERILNIAHADQIALLKGLTDEIDTAAKATDLLRAANRKNYDDYQKQLQSGYIQYAVEKGVAAGIQPGRASGGPVIVGNSYPVNELKGQSEWFTPSVAGQISQGPSGGGNITIPITIQAGAFLGARDDALRLGEQLAPYVKRALQRAG